MLRHVVLMTWNHELSEEEQTEVSSVLDRLGEAVETLRDFHHGPDVALGPGRADYVVVSDFEDPDGFWVYSRHPQHDVVRSVLRPLSAAQSFAQFSIG